MSLVRFWKSLHPQSSITLILGLVGTAVLFAAMSHLEYGRVSYDFERRANNRIAAVENGLQKAADDLAVLNRFFSTAGPISREQFQTFVQPLLIRQPHIQNFAFHRLVSSNERAAYEVGMRRLYPRFAITEVVGTKLVSAGLRDRYRVVEYVEPMQGNEMVLGLDASSRKSQDEAALRACQTGLPSATGPYVLVQQNITLRGLVMLAPLYRPGLSMGNPNSRCQNVIGYTAVIFNAKRLVEQTLRERKLLGAEGYAVAVYADNSRSSDSLIFRTEETNFSEVPSAWTLRDLLYPRPNDLSSTFEVAGRQWEVVVSPIPLTLLKNHLASLLILAGGILASILAAAYMQSLAVRSLRTRQFIEERAEKSIREQTLREANRQLAEERTHLRTLFDQAPSFVAILAGPQHIYEIANLSYYELVGHREIIGKPVREALPELEGQGFYELLDQVYASGEPYLGRGLPIDLQSQPGMPPKKRYVEFIYQPMIDTEGKVTAIFVQGSDISQHTKAQQELEYMASHDLLTGLPNYAQIRIRLNQIMTKAKEERQSVIAMMIGIDRFRSVNESFGNAAADRILKITAKRLQSVAQNSGAVARLDGDKFLLAFPMHENDGLYSGAMQHINNVVGKGIVVDCHEIFLTCSVGIATYPMNAVDAETLIQCADLAMYGAKELGPNNFQLYTPEQNERVRERVRIESALRHALERSEFVLHYQPQVDLRTGSIIAVEALLRWQHPEMGMVSPDGFISIAEDTGLIVPIGEWALRTACAQMKDWQKAGHGNLRIAVNLSARQFKQANLAGLVRKTLDETRLAANCLDLELTESLVMTDVEQAIGILKELGELGVQLSIDDFGTGYSSLAYLKRFPIDVLKIDRSFIREIPNNSNDAAIADAIISMAHSLGMRVIAEGVETEAQCEFLSRNMCDEIQGFIFSKALPASEIEVLLQESRRLPENLLRLQKPARTLLLVDDEPSILSALKRQLRQDGYQIMTATDGQAGLDFLTHNKIDVIVSDQRMPGMTGVEFLRKVKTLYPDTVRIVLSGFTELQSVTDAVNEGAIYKFLTKPWDDNLLREHVANAFHTKEMADENRRLNIEVRTANQELASANRQLEELLKHKQEQIQRREVSLDIVREALQHVPLPVIGLDDDQVVVFANIAADDLFENVGLILGNPVDQVIPELSHLISQHKTEELCIATVNGMSFEILARRMGHGTQSRGSLITFTRRV